MKYLKIFEEFERGGFTSLSAKQFAIVDEFLSNYPYLNIDLNLYKIKASSSDFLYNDIIYSNLDEILKMTADYIEEMLLSFCIWEYEINNGVIDTSYVNMNGRELNIIPFKFGMVGNFLCSHNELTTLKGAPNIVNGDFSCNDNKLTSLEGGPIIVNGSFFCDNNKLTTLKGAPKKVGLFFTCRSNKLTNLKYLPEEVGARICCDNNPNLTDLSDVPEEMRNKIEIDNW